MARLGKRLAKRLAAHADALEIEELKPAKDAEIIRLTTANESLGYLLDVERASHAITKTERDAVTIRANNSSARVEQLTELCDQYMRERDAAQRTIAYFEESLCCTAKKLAIHDGQTTRPIAPEKVARVLRERDVAKGRLNAIIEHCEAEIGQCDPYCCREYLTKIAAMARDGE